MYCPRRLTSLHRIRSGDAGASLAACLIVLTGCTLATGCRGKTAAPPPAVPVATLTMKYRPTAITQDYPALLEASNTVEIRPQVGGILYRQNAVEGTAVSRGQTLFEIEFVSPGARAFDFTFG